MTETATICSSTTAKMPKPSLQFLISTGTNSLTSSKIILKNKLALLTSQAQAPTKSQLKSGPVATFQTCSSKVKYSKKLALALGNNKPSCCSSLWKGSQLPNKLKNSNFGAKSPALKTIILLPNLQPKQAKRASFPQTSSPKAQESIKLHFGLPPICFRLIGANFPQSPHNKSVSQGKLNTPFQEI